MSRSIYALSLVVIVLLIAVFIFVRQKQKKNVDVVYADNNASTPMFPEASAAMVEANARHFSNPSSIHSGGRHARMELEHQRDVIARLLDCSPTELVFTGGATESNNIAIRGVVEHQLRGSQLRVRIVTTPIEHASVSQTVEAMVELRANTNGASVELLTVNVDRFGVIDMAHFSSLLDENHVDLACIIMGNNEIGTIQDVAALSRACKKRGTHLHCDMTQVVGKYRVSLRKLGVDSATMSAHKFHGPKGIGALYLQKRAETETKCCATGGSQEMGVRGGTENVAGVCGMAAALKRCHALISLQEDLRVRSMRDTLKRRLVERLPPATLFNGHPKRCMYNTISLCLPLNSRELVKDVLDRSGVYVNVGCACSNGDSSKTLRAVGLTDAQINGSLRISLSFMNTEDECEYMCDRLVEGVTSMMMDDARYRV